MKKNYSFKKICLALMLCSGLLHVTKSTAQYCAPIFANGCTTWSNTSVTVSGINWTLGSSNCSTFDYTTDTAYMTAGMTYPMNVTNGDWCGCGVWIDYDMNHSFDTIENLFHQYTALQANTYSFNITVPASVPTGVYRMRVIAGWGTDCYTDGTSNGYGPCGGYMYGNFDDFSVRIVNTSGIENYEADNSSFMQAGPNPASSFLNISIKDLKPHAHLRLTDEAGRLIKTIAVSKEKEVMDVSSLSNGIYFLNYSDEKKSGNLKIVK